MKKITMMLLVPLFLLATACDTKTAGERKDEVDNLLAPQKASLDKAKAVTEDVNALQQQQADAMKQQLEE